MTNIEGRNEMPLEELIESLKEEKEKAATFGENVAESLNSETFMTKDDFNRVADQIEAIAPNPYGAYLANRKLGQKWSSQTERRNAGKLVDSVKASVDE